MNMAGNRYMEMCSDPPLTPCSSPRWLAVVTRSAVSPSVSYCLPSWESSILSKYSLNIPMYRPPSLIYTAGHCRARNIVVPSVSVYALWRLNYPQLCKSDLHKQALESLLTRIYQGIRYSFIEQSLFLTPSRCSVTSVLRNQEAKWHLTQMSIRNTGTNFFSSQESVWWQPSRCP